VDGAIENLVHCKGIIGRMVTHEMNNLLGTFITGTGMHSLWLVEGYFHYRYAFTLAGGGE
jgi:hypothetical protein